MLYQKKVLKNPKNYFTLYKLFYKVLKLGFICNNIENSYYDKKYKQIYFILANIIKNNNWLVKIDS